MKTIPARLLDQAQNRADIPAMYTRTGGQWVPTTWGQYGERVMKVAKALISLGFEPGDTTSILGFNTEDWVVFDVGTMMAGGAAAGIYTTCSRQ